MVIAGVFYAFVALSSIVGYVQSSHAFRILAHAVDLKKNQPRSHCHSHTPCPSTLLDLPRVVHRPRTTHRHPLPLGVFLDLPVYGSERLRGEEWRDEGLYVAGEGLGGTCGRCAECDWDGDFAAS